MATGDESGKGRRPKEVNDTPPNERTPLEFTCYERGIDLAISALL